MTILEQQPQIPKRFNDAEYTLLPKDIRVSIDSVRDTRKGIYLWGPIGSGKTYAIYAIRKHLYEIGINCRVYSAPEMFDMIRDDYDHKDSYNLSHILANRGVLIIDDLGTEKASEWVSETMFKIIDKRYREVLPTIITSNLELGELSERLGDRISSRIAEMCDVIKLVGVDRRITNKPKII